MPTVRQQIIELLSREEMGVRDLSQLLGLPEKEVYEHLAHIARTAQGGLGKKLVIRPYRCLLCGYVFKERSRLSRPGRCPRCKKGHLQNATFRIA